jgi:hypothetical protein
MQYTKEQCRYIIAKLDSIGERELHYRYDNMLDDCYAATAIGQLTYDSSYVLKCCDKVAYNCGYADWLDGEIGTSITDEINGEYYDLDEVNCLLEDYDSTESGDKDDAFVT